MMRGRWNRTVAGGLVVALALAACGSDDDSGTTSPTTTTATTTTAATATTTAGSTVPGSTAPATTAAPSGPSDELIAAAKKEGSLVIYSGQPDALLSHVAKLFEAEYDIKVEYTRLLSADLITRFETEAQADAIQADILIASFETPRGPLTKTSDMHDKGYLRYLSEVNLPDPAFPKDFVFQGKTASVLVLPFLIAVNNDLVSDADMPTSFADLTDARFKDQICLNDPRTTTSFLAVYDSIFDELGQEWFDGIRANNPRIFDGGAPAIQALAAGECKANIMQTVTGVAGAIAQGAPISVVVPEQTAALENQLIMVSEEKAPHPKAAELFANWILSKEGSLAMNDPAVLGDGIFSPWQQDELPVLHQYDPATGINADKLKQLFGLS